MTDIESILIARGVPKHWAHSSFETCHKAPVALVNTIRTWADNPKGMMYFYGCAGSGKTTLAVSVMRHILTNRPGMAYHTKFLRERDYLDQAKQEIEFGRPMYTRRTLPDNHPRKIHLLVYDDLASTTIGDKEKDHIATIIEDRHADELPTIITSNLDLQAVANMLDRRLASRINEYGMQIAFPDKDLRIGARS